MKHKNPHAVALGRKGGKTKGPQKARSREHCQKAAKARWSKEKAT